LEERIVPNNTWNPSNPDDNTGINFLRGAVLAFNKDTVGNATDTITLKAGQTYHLDLAPKGADDGTSGDLHITNTKHKLIIQGGFSAGKETTIDANDPKLGSLQDRLFQLSPGTVVEFDNVILKDGQANDDGTTPGNAFGGAILSVGAKLTLNHVTLVNNTARGADSSQVGGTGGDAAGGAIFVKGGSLTLSDVSILNNTASAGKGGPGGVGTDFVNLPADAGNGGQALGGGIFANAATVNVTGFSISGNKATGGNGGDGGPGFAAQDDTNGGFAGNGGVGGSGQGGGFYATGGTVHFNNSIASIFGPDECTNNRATGGNGGAGGDGGASGDGDDFFGPGGNGGRAGLGSGGGFVFSFTTVVTINDAMNIVSNTATGGDGGRGGSGGEGGQAGDGNDADGGGLFTGTTVNFSNLFLTGNKAVGGNGGPGGTSVDLPSGISTGGLGGETFVLPGSGEGGAGGAGGRADGGGLASLFFGPGSVTLTNSRVWFNQATGGDGGNSGNCGNSPSGGFNGPAGLKGGMGGQAEGGGLDVSGITSGAAVTLTNTSFVTNRARGGDGGKGGDGSSAFNDASGSNGGDGGDAAMGAGGGLFVQDATVTVTNAKGQLGFQANQAAGGQGGQGGLGGGGQHGGGSGGVGGMGGLGQGGGLSLTNSLPGLVDQVTASVGGNHATGGDGGAGGTAGSGTGDNKFDVFSTGSIGGEGGLAGSAQGGGLFVSGGTLDMASGVVSKNDASGGTGGAGGTGGRAIVSQGREGGSGGIGGIGQGGGFLCVGGEAILSTLTVDSNFARGGSGGSGGLGYPGSTQGGDGGAGGPGGAGQGGGFAGGDGVSLNLLSSTISNNFVSGGNGGDGNSGAAGDTGGNGGPGGDAGDAQGGGLFFGTTAGTSFLINSTIADNAVKGFPDSAGGHGGDGGPGAQIIQNGNGGDGGTGGHMSGGGLFLAGGTLELHNDTIAENSVDDSAGGVGGQGYPGSSNGAGLFGFGGGVALAGGTVDSFNTLIGLNEALRARDVEVVLLEGNVLAGTFNADHDLISVIDVYSNLSLSVGTDANGNIVGFAAPIDPTTVADWLRLAPLGNYGGPTQTMLLLKGSPAINAGDNSQAVDANMQLLTTDQRGLPRLVGPSVDIGAVEYQGKPDDHRVSGHGKRPRVVKTGDRLLIQIDVANHQIDIVEMGPRGVRVAFEGMLAQAFIDIQGILLEAARGNGSPDPWSYLHPDLLHVAMWRMDDFLLTTTGR
jgi:hypothetical protein